MKVYELKEKLQNLPDNMEIFLYNSIDEGDCSLEEVKVVSTPYNYYCQADSFIDEYLEENNIPVLILHDRRGY